MISPLEYAALQKFRAEVMHAVLRLDGELARLRTEEQASEPLGERGVSDLADPSQREVLVRRTSGPKVEVFHSAQEPCGRVTRKGASPDAYRTLTFSLAERKGLRPCTACGWRQQPVTAVEAQA